MPQEEFERLGLIKADAWSEFIVLPESYEGDPEELRQLIIDVIREEKRECWP